MCWQVAVAHISMPSAASSFLRCILPRWSSVCSIVRSLASLLCAKCTVSVSKSKVQPHHVMLCPNCAFFQLMGALRHVSSAMSRHAASGKSLCRKSERRSSTFQVPCQAMQEAGKESPHSCPPVGTKFSPKMTDSVVKYAVIHLEQYRALLVWVNFYCFVRSFEVQRNALPCAEGVAFLK